jgi:tetratricopeptide (TPR) repeat protein
MAAGPASSSRYYLLLADACAYVGDREHTMPAAERALEEARRCRDETAMGRALCMLAVECYFSGQHGRGVEHALAAVALLEKAEEGAWLARAYWIATNNCIVLGRFDRALELSERLLGIAARMREPRVLVIAAFSRAAISAMTGAWDEGVELGERALAQARHPFTREMAARWLAYAYVERDEPARAIAVLEHFVGLDTEASPTSHIFIAEAYARSGRLELARENASRVWRVCGPRATGSPSVSPSALSAASPGRAATRWKHLHFSKRLSIPSSPSKLVTSRHAPG